MEHRDGQVSVVVPAARAPLADLDRVRVGVDLGQHPEPLVQVDEAEHVRQPAAEVRVAVLADDRERVHGPVAGRLLPADVHTQAGRAVPPGVEDHFPAGGTHLVGQPVILGRGPERRGVRLGQRRQRPLRSYRAGSLVLGHLGQSLPRTMVPAACRVPSWPPLPWATASRAPFTCAVDSPRSCRVASMSRKIPRMPGWLEDRPPPSVFSAGAPGRSKRSRPPATYGPPSPFLAKPRSSRIVSTVIVNESSIMAVSIWPGRTPPCPNASGPDRAAAEVVMSVRWPG